MKGKCLFKHKYHASSSLACHKARWVVCGFSQQYGVDYDETFVHKPATIQTVLSIAASCSCPIHEEDMAVWPVLDTLSGLVGLGVGAHLGSGEAAMDQRSLIHYRYIFVCFSLLSTLVIYMLCCGI